MQRSDAQGPLYPDSSFELQCKDTLILSAKSSSLFSGWPRDKRSDCPETKCLASDVRAMPRVLSIVLQEELTRAKIAYCASLLHSAGDFRTLPPVIP